MHAVPAPTAVRPTALDDFRALARQAIAAATFESLVVSGNRASGDSLRSVRARLITLRGATALSLTFSDATRDTTTNRFDADAGLDEMLALLDPAAKPSFTHATLHAGGGVVEIRVSRKGQQTLRHERMAAPGVSAAPSGTSIRRTPATPAAHDRVKARRLRPDLPIWQALGLTDTDGTLVPSMARKWRQIDKFVEVIENALDALPADPEAATRPLRVVDFGCGKGYLTFAVQALLAARGGPQPEVTGVELRADLVDFCNAAATRAGVAGIRFVQGDLRSVAAPDADVVIALHACDTATDHALALGVAAGAGVLVCSPCCHKELRPQMAGPRPLAAVFRHGIHLGQEAEMVTDSLRALLLESCGYRAQVFEFVALEHTSKNKMILATRRDRGLVDGIAQKADALAQVRDVKEFYGIREQCLETLLRQRASSDTPTQACQTP